MDINEMIKDFCKRSRTEYKEDIVRKVMNDNYHIITDSGFVVFNIVYNEIHCLFLYVVPGSKPNVFRDFVKFIEEFGKSNGCTKAKFITCRDKGFSRLLRDYSPCAIMYEKEI